MPGEAVDPAIAEDSIDRAAALVTARWQRAAQVLADLHRTDLVALRVTGEPARQPREELELWCATMTAARMDDDPVFLRLREAMLADVPQFGRRAPSSTGTSGSATSCSTARSRPVSSTGRSGRSAIP